MVQKRKEHKVTGHEHSDEPADVEDNLISLVGRRVALLGEGEHGEADHNLRYHREELRKIPGLGLGVRG